MWIGKRKKAPPLISRDGANISAVPPWFPCNVNARALKLCLTRSHVASYCSHGALPQKVPKRGSGGKLRNCLNLKKLTAGDFFSLKEDNSLKRHHSLCVFPYYATGTKFCQDFFPLSVIFSSSAGVPFPSRSFLRSCRSALRSVFHCLRLTSTVSQKEVFICRNCFSK